MSAPIVVPAIIPQSLEHLREHIAALAGAVREIQIDIVDGALGGAPSWPFVGTADTADVRARIGELCTAVPAGITFELDLMIAHPSATLPFWLAQKPAGVVFHIEGFVDDAEVSPALALCASAGARAILAAGNATPLPRLLALLPPADGVECMGIAAIGRQGNPFDERVLARIRALRERLPTLSISVDGSVNERTIPALKAAGANRFVVGSAIFDAEDPAGAYTRLCELIS